jgi:hypothetical protein
MLPELADKLQDYIYEIELPKFTESNNRVRRATHEYEYIHDRVAVFPVMRCMYFPVHDDSGSSGKCKDIVRCTSTNFDIRREDFVLVHTATQDVIAEGMDGKRIAQVHVLFTIDYWSMAS